MPQIIENGYVYIAQPPLYKVQRNRNDKGVFLKDEQEMADYLRKLALKDAELFKNKTDLEAGVSVRGTPLEEMVDEYLAADAVIQRLGGAIDRGALLAIAAGTSINLEIPSRQKKAPKLLRQKCAIPM